jgi:hypothetical protein
VEQQMSIASKFNWNQVRMEINLRRYIVYSHQGRDDLAEQMLTRAATIWKKGEKPTTEDIDVLRKMAKELYESKRDDKS